MLIVGAIELGDGNIPGRLRLAEISSYGAADLGHFVETAADPDAIAKTDGWSGYAAVPADRHNVHVVGKTAAHLVLPWIHQVFSNLKGWARGVYHGLRRKHLQAYLDEFVFRFNRRKTRHAAFRSLFRLATNAEPLTYSMLIEPGAMCISGSRIRNKCGPSGTAEPDRDRGEKSALAAGLDAKRAVERPRERLGCRLGLARNERPVPSREPQHETAVLCRELGSVEHRRLPAREPARRA